MGRISHPFHFSILIHGLFLIKKNVISMCILVFSMSLNTTFVKRKSCGVESIKKSRV